MSFVAKCSPLNTTPLDLVYDMPPGIKPVPANMWVWELRERIEEAHTLVRKYSEGSILRQKTYHDNGTFPETTDFRTVAPDLNG
jgi:hypothetical protein